MSLAHDLQKATLAAFKVADSVLSDITYRVDQGSEYSPPTGVVTQTFTDYDIRAALSSFKKNEMTTGISSGSNQYPQLIQPNDIKCAFPRQLKELPATFEPKLTDVVIENSSPAKSWDIVRVLSPPGAAVVLLHMRQT